MTQKEINVVLEKCLRMCDEVGIPYGDIRKISISGKMSKAMGKCWRYRNAMHGIEWFEIKIAKLAADNFSSFELENVVLHEIIHTCKGAFDHGSTFHKYGNLVNKRYGYHVETYWSFESVGVTPEQMNYKYIFRCDKCGKEFGYMRMCKVVKLKGKGCRCGVCKGTITML